MPPALAGRKFLAGTFLASASVKQNESLNEESIESVFLTVPKMSLLVYVPLPVVAP